MLSYCLKCRKTTECKSHEAAKTSKGKLILLLKCAGRGTKKLIVKKIVLMQNH